MNFESCNNSLRFHENAIVNIIYKMGLNGHMCVIATDYISVLAVVSVYHESYLHELKNYSVVVWLILWYPNNMWFFTLNPSVISLISSCKIIRDIIILDSYNDHNSVSAFLGMQYWMVYDNKVTAVPGCLLLNFSHQNGFIAAIKHED